MKSNNFSAILICCIAMVYSFNAATAGPTVYASAINHTAAGGISSFNPKTGISTENVAFSALEARAQVTADGTKAVYVTYIPSGSHVVIVYSMQNGDLLASIPIASDGNLALSPNSIFAYVNAIENGVGHVFEVNLESFTLVLDVAYSAISSGPFAFPIAVSSDGGTVFTEDNNTLYALDSATLKPTNSALASLPEGLGVTSDGRYLFGLVEVQGSAEAIQFVSTSTLAITGTVDLPSSFTYGRTIGIAISGDSSTIAVLGFLTNYGNTAQQPIGVLDVASETFTYALIPEGAYSALAISQDGSNVYLGDETGLVSIFHPQTSTVSPAFAAAEAVASLQVGAQGALFAVYYINVATVVGVDLSTKQITHTFAIPSGSASSFTVLGDTAGTRLYASGRPTVAGLPQASVQRFGPVPPSTATYTALAWNAGQTGIWAAGAQTLDLLDPNTLIVQQSIALGGGDIPLGANALVITPDQTTALVTYGKDTEQGVGSGLIVVNLAAGTTTGSILESPKYIALSPDSNYAYISSVQVGPGNPHPYYPVILEFDISTRTIVQEFSIPVTMNREASSLAISADGAALYTTAAGRVFAIDSTDGHVIWSVAPGVDTAQVATIPGSTDVITSDYGSNNLTRLNSDGQKVDTINVGMLTTYLTVLAN